MQSHRTYILQDMGVDTKFINMLTLICNQVTQNFSSCLTNAIDKRGPKKFTPDMIFCGMSTKRLGSDIDSCFSSVLTVVITSYRHYTKPATGEGGLDYDQ